MHYVCHHTVRFTSCLLHVTVDLSYDIVQECGEYNLCMFIVIVRTVNVMGQWTRTSVTNVHAGITRCPWEYATLLPVSVRHVLWDINAFYKYCNFFERFCIKRYHKM